MALTFSGMLLLLNNMRGGLPPYWAVDGTGETEALNRALDLVDWADDEGHGVGSFEYVLASADRVIRGVTITVSCPLGMSDSVFLRLALLRHVSGVDCP